MNSQPPPIKPNIENECPPDPEAESGERSLSQEIELSGDSSKLENESSRDQSAESSKQQSREGSRPPRKKNNVRFRSGGESLDISNQKASFDIRDGSGPSTKPHNMKTPPRPRSGTGPPAQTGNTTSTNENHPDPPGGKTKLGGQRSAIVGRPTRIELTCDEIESKDRARSKDRDRREEESVEDDGPGVEDNDAAVSKAVAAKIALDRADVLSRVMHPRSAPGSRYASPVRMSGLKSPPPSPPPGGQDEMPLDLNELPLHKLESKRTKYGIEDETDDDDEGEEIGSSHRKKKKRRKRKNNTFHAAARTLIGRHTSKDRRKLFKVDAGSPELESGQQTPISEQDHDDYVPRPKEYREGYLSTILKLYQEEGMGSAIAHIPPASHDAFSRATGRISGAVTPLMGSMTPARTPGTTPATSPAHTPRGSPTSSGNATPKEKHQKWYYKNQQSQSTGALSDLVNGSIALSQPGGSKARPKPKHRPRSFQAIESVKGKIKKGPKTEDSIRIQVHLAETMQRHAYLLKICRALMTYGAPTHRLEECMRMSARVLEINGQFLYIPGCMIISLDDASTHTTEVQIVRAAQGVNLGKLRDTHEVYKEVVHDLIHVEDAMKRLDEINRRKDQYNVWIRVMVYGFASACVGPFAFGARPIDLPIAFILGCLLGIMQLVIAPRSELYSNIFEITAAVFTSFLARAFGSIRHNGTLFCFSALAQSAIAMILPGYTVLCGSLELQSRNIVAGSVRMIYAVIYSLFLGFGITIGTSFYGGMDKHASSETICSNTMPFWFKFIFVPPFTLCLIVINNGKWKQMPIMVSIAFVGYFVSYFSAKRFPSNVQIANTLGAFAIGVLGNLYSRLRHGLAAAALLPAIFVQVPSGLAALGSLVSGIESADQINFKKNGTTSTSGLGNDTNANNGVLTVAYSTIQIAIGITVGLFLSALVVYPFGKRRSGLFSF